MFWSKPKSNLKINSGVTIGSLVKFSFDSFFHLVWESRNSARVPSLIVHNKIIARKKVSYLDK